MASLDSLAEDLRDGLTETDLESSATQQSLDDLVPVLRGLEAHRSEIDTMLDIGCGYGGVTRIFADHLDVKEVHGVDLDDERLEVARSRGVTTHKLDLEQDPFPFEADSVDLVVSFGVLEHLRFFDHVFGESDRILRDGGYVVHSIPNLASWINRIALLLGRQPRDVEISNQKAFGILDQYPDRHFLNHVHSPTKRAFVELCEYYGFDVVDVRGIFPYQESFAVELVDRVTARWPSLCRRLVVTGVKRREPETGVEDRITFYDEETDTYFTREHREMETDD